MNKKEAMNYIVPYFYVLTNMTYIYFYEDVVNQPILNIIFLVFNSMLCISSLLTLLMAFFVLFSDNIAKNAKLFKINHFWSISFIISLSALVYSGIVSDVSKTIMYCWWCWLFGNLVMYTTSLYTNSLSKQNNLDKQD